MKQHFGLATNSIGASECDAIVRKLAYLINITQKPTFIQRIFSLKNSPNKKHKIIMFLGMKLKIKYHKKGKKKRFIEKLFSIKNTPNKEHKVITFLGFQLKLKRKTKNEKFNR